MPTLTFNTGFEHQVLSTTIAASAGATALFSSITGAPAITAAAARSGAVGLRCDPAEWVSLGTVGTSVVGRFYFRFDATPSVAGRILTITNNLSVYITTSKFIEVRTTAGAVEFTGTNALTANTWYRLDIKSDSATDVWSIRVTADLAGTVMESVTDDAYGVAVSSAGSVLMGNVDSATMVVDIDDLAWSVTMADFPIGAGYGALLLPASLTLASSGAFVQNATATAIGTGDSTLLGDVPIDEAASFIRQTTGSATQPGGSTKVNFANSSADTIQGVQACIAYGAASTTANTWRVWAAANSVDTYLHGTSGTQPSIGSAGPVFSTKQVANGGVAWTDAMFDGVQVFFGTGGGTDVNPVPRMNNVILEVDYVPVVTTPRHQAYTLHRRQAIFQAVR